MTHNDRLILSELRQYHRVKLQNCRRTVYRGATPDARPHERFLELLDTLERALSDVPATARH